MIPRLTRPFFAALSVIVALVMAGCEKAPLLAPTGSSITLTSGTNAIPANGTATIVAQVLESAGTPPHSGTRVTFTTTLGVIEPPEASTDASGRTSVTFRASGASGIAVISASSGGATTSTGGSSSSTGTGTGTTTGSSDRNLRIAVGAAAVGRVNLSANPTMLPTNGGTTTVLANVLDINGNALSAAVVSFTTTAGNLSSSSATTDGNGNATVTLTTFQQATVTATVGVSSSSGSGGSTGTGGSQGTSPSQASVTVSLTSAPTASITVPSTPPSAGLPASYTIKVTPATATGSGGSGGGTGGSTGSTIPIREVLLAWGDGLSENLGAVSGEQSVSHVYAHAGSYSITLNVTDVAGGTARVSTSVAVIQAPPPTINITYSPVPAKVNTLTTINVQITTPQGLSVINTVIDFGDGTSASLGGGSSSSQPHVYTAVGTYTVKVTVTDSSGQTTVGTTSLSVGL